MTKYTRRYVRYAEKNALAAICVRRNGVDSMYYVHPDRLGSYTHITNANKQVIRNLHFDPWGNVKTDTDWRTFDSTTLSGFLAGTIRFSRGFTGHEHYADMKIINMNGRLYDPVIARFFSPDNFVQAPEFTQSYNRYSYCLNNPLQWVDPSGEDILDPWYRDAIGIVRWTDSEFKMPKGGFFLGSEGVFTSDGEMRYYYADGRISNLKLPQVFIDWGNPVDFTFSSSPLKGAGFYRIGDPSEQMGSFSSNFRYVAPINPGYINGLNAYGVANGVKTNLIEAAVRYDYKSANSWWEFQHLRPKQQEFRKSRTLGKTGAKYLKTFEKIGRSVAIVSWGLETYNYVSYSMLNGLQWDVSLKYGLDVAMLIAGTIGGPVGLAISTSYFVLDLATDGFGGFGKMY
ncbi:MAG: RHS repeat-associated core domain-containing protein [Bacteroidales bacterium]|nr:RHS repeat-associated core domain-containing protein [Bacteroidales bacterium]